jgi:hypothetical protein
MERYRLIREQELEMEAGGTVASVGFPFGGGDQRSDEIPAVIYVAIDERLDEQLTCRLPRSTLDVAAQAVAQTVGLFIGDIAADQDIRWPDLPPIICRVPGIAGRNR